MSSALTIEEQDRKLILDGLKAQHRLYSNHLEELKKNEKASKDQIEQTDQVILLFTFFVLIEMDAEIETS